MKGSIVTFSGDNLTSQAIGGFTVCFTSGRICRHCMASRIAVSAIDTEEKCLLRSVLVHNCHVENVLADSSLTSCYGVKERCPLALLEYFYPIQCLPPDAMHDILEGLMGINFSIVIKGFVKKRLFSIQQLKTLIQELNYGEADACDKPNGLCIPNNFIRRNKTISGKAVEKWMLFHLLSIFVSHLIIDSQDYKNDDVWKLHLLCRQITQIILTPEVDINWIPVLQLLISRHHVLLHMVSLKSFTPKFTI